jgi:hypothetical protein
VIVSQTAKVVPASTAFSINDIQRHSTAQSTREEPPLTGPGSSHLSAKVKSRPSACLGCTELGSKNRLNFKIGFSSRFQDRTARA